MLRDKQKKISNFLLTLFVLLTAMHMPMHADLTTLAKNDPIPVFTTLNIDDALLLTRDQLLYKFDALSGWDYEWADKKRDHVNVSISPFAQNADRGKTIQGSREDLDCCNSVPDPDCPTTTTCNFTIIDTPLGDLTGRTDMIALLYGAIPAGQTQAPTLAKASTALFPGGVGLNDEANIDPAQRLGFFSFPLKYRKRGLRVEATGLVSCGVGLRFQAGFSTIRQVRQATINLTDTATFEPKTPTVTKENVDEFLMDQILQITDEIHIDFCDFVETSLEDIRFNIFWRDFFPVNEDAESTWARFLAIPYFQFSGSFSPVKIDRNRRLFAAPFGDNGHGSIGLTAGVNLDFIETIEIGGEVGFTHFFRRKFCNMPVPTSEFQNNLYPFSTNVAIHPGENWHFCARLAAYHFLDRLSMHFEWYVLDHQKDHIKVLDCDPAFMPEVLECKSTFKVKLGNIGLNYDLSPNFNIGLLWQIPFSQRNAFRSSTIMAGLNITF